MLSTLSSSSVLICHFSLILFLLLLLFSIFAPSSISACFPLPLLPGIAHPTLSQSEVSRCSCGSLKAGRSKVGIRPKQRDGMMMCSVCVCVYLVLDVLKLMCRETWGAIGKNTYIQTHTHWNIFYFFGGGRTGESWLVPCVSPASHLLLNPCFCVLFSLCYVFMFERKMGIWVVALEISFVPTKSHKELMFIFLLLLLLHHLSHVFTTMLVNCCIQKMGGFSMVQLFSYDLKF